MNILSDTGAGTIAFLLLIATALLLTACGNEALRVNASVAHAMLEVQAESGPAIRELRINAAVEAGRAVHDRGGSESEAQAAASAAADRWQCAIDGHRIYAQAVGAYIDAIALWQAGEPFEVSQLFPFVRRAIDSYRYLSSCLSSLGSDALPAVPSFFNLIPESWGVQ